MVNISWLIYHGYYWLMYEYCLFINHYENHRLTID